ncbi:hypothetical protein OIU77_010644 [Salix suchowensis]|uniref:Uncharacterized protein n=1 Tax=Salix suchowensis TaxID=1278906 RepID=A0ABQ9A941_9ROSI|nr:hypothetical protein OIU77_010644 [Salix suchowensis]
MQQNRNLQLLISQNNHFFPVKHSPPQLSQSSSREHLTQQEEALLIKLVVLLLHLQYLPVPKWWVQKSVIGVGIPAQMIRPRPLEFLLRNWIVCKNDQKQVLLSIPPVFNRRLRFCS